MRRSLTLTVSVLAFLTAAFIGTGCDSGSSGEERQVTINGTVTEDVAYGKSADVQGAVVSATSVYADGRTVQHPDTAVTTASGSFSLRIEDSADIVVLEAIGASLESRVIVTVGNGDEHDAAPMNAESTLESDVLLAATASGLDLTVPQIAAFVDARLAAEHEANSVDASALASVIFRGQAAEEEYVREREDDGNPKEEPVADKREADEVAYERQESDLHDAQSDNAEAAAVAQFDATFSSGYADVGLSAELNAEASDARRSAVTKFAADANLSAEAQAAVVQRAEIYSSVAVGAAVRASFVAAGAATATLNAVDSAVETLVSAVASAQTSVQIDAAFDAFGATIETQLAVELSVPETTVEAALLATATARGAFDAAIDVAADGEAIAAAHKQFYSAAELAAATTLAASADAEVAASILALVAAR